MTIFRRTNSNPMMTLLKIWLMILPQFRERNIINHFADRNTQATSLETTTQINGSNSYATLNKCLPMTKKVTMAQSQASIRMNDHNN